jgi:hypothetical protein
LTGGKWQRYHAHGSGATHREAENTGKPDTPANRTRRETEHRGNDSMSTSSGPWYRTALRWGQTNLVEIDPGRYDHAWWRAQWRRTRVQGVIVNAGGIVAYYPSEVPFHNRAAALDGRDLYGEIVRAAREEGLKVIARMDSNRVTAEFYRAHPDWIAIDQDGQPYRAAERYVTCINSPYYGEYLPQIMQEVIRRSQPDGFSDNSWSGLRRGAMCHCVHCREAFFDFAGLDLPRRQDWDNEAFRQWVRWNYQRRTELWELNNLVTTTAGGPDCRWMGMVSGDVLNNGSRYIDIRAIMSRSVIVMLDHQRRNGVDGFEQNTEAGKRLHELVGWDALIPESTPQYQLGAPAFRLSSMPAAEVRLWSSSGFAGGIQPWWHHIGAMHEDRRQYATAEPIFRWHETNQDILIDRQPLADVGVVWSPGNHDFHGRDAAEQRTMDPYRGVTRALERAGLTYLPVHADDLAGAAARFGVLILPNLAAMSDAQARMVEAFAAAGGSIIATSETGGYTDAGDARPDFALAGLFGVHRGRGAHGGQDVPDASHDVHSRHTYLRLAPELRSGVEGPHDATAPEAAGTRHPLLAGFDDADTLPFGGFLPVVGVDADVTVLATFIPDFPIFPPETAWMRQPRTDLPCITVRRRGASKLVWFVADLDRCYARDEAFEHAALIANAVRWALAGRHCATLEGGGGLVSLNLYRQAGRRILHLNNRLTTSRVPGRQSELVPVGPVRVRLALPPGRTPPRLAELRVSGLSAPITASSGEVEFAVDRVLDHEVAVLDWPD